MNRREEHEGRRTGRLPWPTRFRDQSASPRLNRVGRVIGPPNFEVVPKPDLKDNSPLSLALRSICLITRPDRDQGTGFLIAPDLLMTNQHVLPNEEIAGGSTAQFGVWRDSSGETLEGNEYRLTVDSEFTSKRKLDYAICRVEGLSAGPIPHLDLDWCDEARVKDQAMIIGHPGGRPMEMVDEDNEIIKVESPFFRYRTDTEAISSGSPVFGEDLKLLGIHHYGFKQSESEGNEGVLIGPIVEDWKGKK